MPDGLIERIQRMVSHQNDDDEDIFGGMPTGGSSRDRDERSGPIGVPENYRVPRVITSRPATTADALASHARAGHTLGATLQQRPLYNEGDQYRPASTSPAAISRLQASLAAAGLLDDFRMGVWDRQSQEAYSALLAEANAAGITADAALRNRAAGITFGGGSRSSGGAGASGVGGRWEFDENGEPVFVPDQYVPPPLTIRTTNRDDLIRALRTGIIEKMGVGWNQQQIGELADLYIQQEAQAQRANYDQQIALERTAFEQGEAAVAGQVINEVEPPSPETFMENELRRRDPTGYQAAGVVNTSLPMFEEALRGWS